MRWRRALIGVVVVGLAALSGCDKVQVHDLTPWLRVRVERPRVSYPHAFDMGPTRTIVRRRVGQEWIEGECNCNIQVIGPHRDAAVVRQIYPETPLIIHADGTSVALPAERCSDEPAVTPDASEVVCEICTAQGPSVKDRCTALRTTLFRLDGTSSETRDLEVADGCDYAGVYFMGQTQVVGFACDKTCVARVASTGQEIARYAGYCDNPRELAARNLRASTQHLDFEWVE